MSAATLAISWIGVIAACLLPLLPLTAHASGTQLTYFGHASFEFVTPGGTRIIVDPYGNSWWSHWFDRPFPSRHANFVLVTHSHFDHNAWERIPGPSELINTPGARLLDDATVVAVAGHHARAERYGDQNLVFVLNVDGLRFVIWGDNDANLTPELSQHLGRVDILMLPIDESQHLLTLDEVATLRQQIAPRVLIPIHYFAPPLTSTCSTLETIDNWLTSQSGVRRPHSHTIRLSQASLPARPEIWVLSPLLAQSNITSGLSGLPCLFLARGPQFLFLAYLVVGLLFALRIESLRAHVPVREVSLRVLLATLAWPYLLLRYLDRRVSGGRRN